MDGLNGDPTIRDRPIMLRSRFRLEYPGGNPWTFSDMIARPHAGLANPQWPLRLQDSRLKPGFSYMTDRPCRSLPTCW